MEPRYRSSGNCYSNCLKQKFDRCRSRVKAIIHNDGTVTLANLLLQPFYTFAQRESLEGMRVLQSDLNPSQTKLALSFSDNGIVVYDLVDKTTKEVRT